MARGFSVNAVKRGRDGSANAKITRRSAPPRSRAVSNNPVTSSHAADDPYNQGRLHDRAKTAVTPGAPVSR